jgi:hypothetical protein
MKIEVQFARQNRNCSGCKYGGFAAMKIAGRKLET